MDVADRQGACGYRSAEFAASHAHEGTSLELRGSGSWLVRRSVPGHPRYTDATACYPLLVCADWEHLPDDLAALVEVVSVTAVLDPLAEADPGVLHAAFPDLLVPYKRHFIVDLGGYGTAALGSHHRRNVARGHRSCRVEEVADPASVADEWVGLYDQLRARHGVIGRSDLPPPALRQQLSVPGTRLWRADTVEGLAGMVIWMVCDRRAYYHLAAYTQSGYDERAAYALFDVSLRELAAVADLALLGGGAGVRAADEDDGLVRFKKGWGGFERTAHLGGRVIDRPTYAQISEGHPSGFFPAYRSPAQRSPTSVAGP
jgi:hypothetical protein